MLWLTCIASNVVLALLLALGAWLVERQFKWHALARVLWVLVLVKLVTPPLVIVPLGDSPEPTACELGVCACGPHLPAPTSMGEMLPWTLLIAWSMGAVATLVIAGRRWVRFGRLLSHARPAPQEWQSLASHFAAELSLRRAPEMLVAPGRLPPLVAPRLGRTCLLLPRDLLAQLSDSQKSALVLHELIHLKRRDHWVRMLEVIVGAVYWWLPIVGLIGRRLRACEERSCDTAVATYLPHARRDYARLLLDVFEFANPLPQQTVPYATAMSPAKHELEQRLCAILDQRERARVVWPVVALATLLAFAVLPCQLEYNLAAWDVPLGEASQQSEPTRSTMPEPTSSETQPLLENPAVEVSSLSCCPS